MKITVAGLAMAAAATLALAQMPASKSVAVPMKNGDGKDIGGIIVSPATRGLDLTLKLHDLPPGPLSFHVHQKPICEPPEFNSAGLHFDPGNRYYGNPHRGHDGIVAAGNPNHVVTVDAKGNVDTVVNFPDLTMGDDDHSVFSNGGTSIVIHADVSKMPVDTPTRTGCGIIRRQ